ncbi:MAG: hypothetical protein U0521_10345 [Anaerolineae bacterium]
MMETLVNTDGRAPFLDRIKDRRTTKMEKPAPAVALPGYDRINNVPPAPDIPTPPFWGARTIREMPLEIVLHYLEKKELYRLSWGAGNTHGDEWKKLEAEFEARLDRMTRAALRGTIKPQAVYGYFPANSDGDDLVIYDPAPFVGAHGNAPAEKTEIARFRISRASRWGNTCASATIFCPRATRVIWSIRSPSRS